MNVRKEVEQICVLWQVRFFSSFTTNQTISFVLSPLFLFSNLFWVSHFFLLSVILLLYCREFVRESFRLIQWRICLPTPSPISLMTGWWTSRRRRRRLLTRASPKLWHSRPVTLPVLRLWSQKRCLEMEIRRPRRLAKESWKKWWWLRKRFRRGGGGGERGRGRRSRSRRFRLRRRRCCRDGVQGGRDVPAERRFLLLLVSSLWSVQVKFWLGSYLFIYWFWFSFMYGCWHVVVIIMSVWLICFLKIWFVIGDKSLVFWVVLHFYKLTGTGCPISFSRLYNGLIGMLEKCGCSYVYLEA